jgi:hypothetical protein
LALSKRILPVNLPHLPILVSPIFRFGIAATATGEWTATIPAPLDAGQGIRTSSTSAQYNTIPNMNAGTTAGLSELYLPVHQVFLPLLRKP